MLYAVCRDANTDLHVHVLKGMNTLSLMFGNFFSVLYTQNFCVGTTLIS